MELKVYTNEELKALAFKRRTEKDERMIRRAVAQIHASIVNRAGEGYHSVQWNCELYPFDNFIEYDLRHIVETCARLSKLFPDASITRPRPKEILVQW